MADHTRVLARHLKTGRQVELVAGAEYAPKANALEKALEMELENQLDPLLAEYRRRRLNALIGKKL